MDDLIKVFKALGEPTRLKILKMLSLQSMCVCELSEVLDMLQPRISQHLKILKDAGVVEENKEGNFTYYSLKNRSKLKETWEKLNLFLDAGLMEVEGFAEASRRFAGLPCNARVLGIKEKIKNEGGTK